MYAHDGSVHDLPRGTVTFLFTDIEGSTRLLDALGAEAYADALAEHRRALREAFARHDGVEVDTQGDAFFYAFPTAPGALRAAAEGQAALADGPISVRMGVHTGTPYPAEEGYVGADVHRAARIAAAAHGGQVVLSASAAALALSDSLRDLGEHRLKDLSAAERLYQLGNGEFPPLRSLYRTNLPVPSTPFLGRERELAEVGALLVAPETRLLTLTGPGGSGKSRLALQSAALGSDDFPDGVYWVPLATLRDPDLVLVTASRVLDGAGDLPSQVADRRLLLLLDNFEQVVEAAGGLAELLAACPGLVLLVTSREPLRLTAEQEYPVPPFAHEEAVGFFLARARSVDPAFEADDTVSEICRRLDDLPLALELAAARVKALTTARMLERLEERLPLLTGGARDLPERQRTLRATIDWSYDLLGDEEQRVFRWLGVFVGGCTLAAAEEVTGAGLDTLESLLGRSLLRRTGERYWMLETIREYAADRLREAGEDAEAGRRHAEFFLTLAESANLSADVLDLETRHEVVIPEAGNLRAAFDRALARGEVELAGSIGVALEQYWVVASPQEGARRMAELLTREAELSPRLRARVLRVRGGTITIAGRREEGDGWHEKSLVAFRELGDEPAVAHLLFRVAIGAYHAGDAARARALCDESLGLHHSVSGEAQVLSLLAEMAFDEGRGEEALELLDRSARLAGEIGFTWWQIGALQSSAEYALRLGKLDDASGPTRQSLEMARAIHNRQNMAYGLTLRAWLAAAQGRTEESGRLWGALEAESERSPFGNWERERDEYGARIVGTTPEFERGYVRGLRLSLDQAVDEALAMSP
jgi:predicted ATPase/class 3 adenylate cyclase